MIRQISDMTLISETVNRYICDECGMALTVLGINYHDKWHKKMEDK